MSKPRELSANEVAEELEKLRDLHGRGVVTRRSDAAVLARLCASDGSSPRSSVG